VEGIFDYIRRLGALVGAGAAAGRYAHRAAAHVDAVRAAAAALPRHPRVYFEEWDDPIITGIQWVAELLRIAGGVDVFPELATQPLAKNRILADAGEVVRRDPQIIFGSWCGKRFRPEQVAARPGWDMLGAVRARQVFEIKSPIILQPGPAALFDGLDALHAHIRAWALRDG
jgi:iron complex transport system substrate-binding protein